MFNLFTARKQKIKAVAFLFMAFIMLFVSVFQVAPIKKVKANFVTDLICSFETGHILYNIAYTDLLPFTVFSISGMASNEDVDKIIYNRIVKVGGYEIGSDADPSKELTPFDKFGLAGLNWSSYAGEWKYYYLDACVEGMEDVQGDDYGRFYEGRFEPQATFRAAINSNDPRTVQFVEHVNNRFIMAFKDALYNILFGIGKFFAAFAIAFIGIVFGDITEFLGLTEDFQGSVFSNLYNNFFIPLSVIMFLLTAIYIIWKGLIKRQVREVLVQGIVKTVLAFIITVIVAANPIFVTYPNKLATIAQAYVVNAVAIGSGDRSDLCGVVHADTIEDPSSPDFFTNVTKRLRSQMGCLTWRTFLFEPWLYGQFGEDVKYGDLKNIGNTNSHWVGQPEVQLGTRSVTNWGLLHLSTQTSDHSHLGTFDSPLISGVHKDWWRIVDATSNYNVKAISLDSEAKEMFGDGPTGIYVEENGETIVYIDGDEQEPTKYWHSWNGNDGSRGFLALLATIFAIVGSIAPMVFAIAGSIYSLGITFLVLVAPIFLLLGCWAGRGQEISKNWLHSLLSYMLKKIFMAFLLVLSVVIIGAVMDVLRGFSIINSIIMMVLLTIALIKNRKKIINQITSKISSVKIGNGTVLAPFSSAASRVTRSGVRAATTAAGVTYSATRGAVAGIETGAGIGSGMVGATKTYIRDRLYRSERGSYYAMLLDRGSVDPQETYLGKLCNMCGAEIEEDDMVFIDSYGIVYCWLCGSSMSDSNLTPTIIDTEENIYSLGQRGHQYVMRQAQLSTQEFNDSMNALIDPLLYGQKWNNTQLMRLFNANIGSFRSELTTMYNMGYRVKDIKFPEMIIPYLNYNHIANIKKNQKRSGLNEVEINRLNDEYIDAWERFIHHNVNKLEDLDPNEVNKVFEELNKNRFGVSGLGTN